MDTRSIRAIWHVPSVSVLTGFHCNNNNKNYDSDNDTDNNNFVVDRDRPGRKFPRKHSWGCL